MRHVLGSLADAVRLIRYRLPLDARRALERLDEWIAARVP